MYEIDRTKWKNRKKLVSRQVDQLVHNALFTYKKCILAYAYTYAHAHHAHIDIRLNTHTHAHTQTHIYTHTHAHT